MKYRCEIFIDKDQENIYTCLKNEEKKLPRSRIEIRKGKIILDAKDAVMLRALTNSISKLLIVHEKMKDVR